LFLAIVVLSAFIIKPFLIPVLTSFILAYLFYPINKWLNGKIKRKNISALIVSLIIILIIIIPLSFMLFEVSKEANVGYIVLKQKISKGTLFDVNCEDGLICSGVNKLKEYTNEQQVRFYLEDSLKTASTKIAQGAISFIFSLPKRLLDVLLTFFIIFFLLRDGETIVKKIEKTTPLKQSVKNKIFSQMHEVTRAIIHGFFLMAVLQGIIGAITFSLFGITSPIIWGIVIAILAFIPFIGSMIIWIPAAAIKLAGGSIGAAIGITIGGLIMSTLDTFIKPKIVGDKAAIHPVIIMLGFLGGLSLLGPIGIIVGPLILALLITFIKLYKE
jgi:predicted PurR-regulated permease PerM